MSDISSSRLLRWTIMQIFGLAFAAQKSRPLVKGKTSFFIQIWGGVNVDQKANENFERAHHFLSVYAYNSSVVWNCFVKFVCMLKTSYISTLTGKCFGLQYVKYFPVASLTDWLSACCLCPFVTNLPVSHPLDSLKEQIPLKNAANYLTLNAIYVFYWLAGNHMRFYGRLNLTIMFKQNFDSVIYWFALFFSAFSPLLLPL